MTGSFSLTPSGALTLEAVPDEGETERLFQAVKPALPPLAQRLELLVLDDGGFRTRFREGIALDVRLRVTAKDGKLDVRVAGAGHLRLPALALLDWNRGIPLVYLDDLEISRDPRRLAVAAHIAPLPPISGE